MITLTLTSDELFTIAAALHAVSPSGGGSREFTLARKVSDIAARNAHGPAFDQALNARHAAYLQTAAAEFNGIDE